MESRQQKRHAKRNLEKERMFIGLRKQIVGERTQRISAQRGLVPYVRSLQKFNEWLQQRPELYEQVKPILKELGLWNIRVGYDPDEDDTLAGTLS